jgi:hypothetical protein
MACALHFRVELTEVDFAIYLRGLSDVDDSIRLVAAIARATKECKFMPKLKEIIERIPEKETASRAPDHLKLVREFDEPYSNRLKVHVYEYEGGYRQVKLVPR